MIYYEKIMVGYWHILGSQLSDAMKTHLMGVIRQDLSLAQYKTCVKQKTLRNELITCDRSFVLSSDVENFIKKKANELW